MAQLWGEERDAWVQVAAQGGRREWCHRRCHVSRQLEAASYRKARSSYARAKQVVYPSPAKSLEAAAARRSREARCPRCAPCPCWPCLVLALPLAGAAVHTCGRGELTPASFPCVSPPAERYGLSCRALEPLSEDADPQPAVEHSGANCNDDDQDAAGGRACELAVHAVPPAVPDWPQLASAFAGVGDPLARQSGSGSPRSDLSVASSLPCSSDGSSAGGGVDCRALRRLASGSGSSDGGCDPSGRRLHRPSPIKLPALLEAKLVRKRSNQLGFDRCAQLSDPDGAEGRAWYEGQLRHQHERDLAEAAAAAARPLPARRASLLDAFKAASQETFSAKSNMRV